MSGRLFLRKFVFDVCTVFVCLFDFFFFLGGRLILRILKNLAVS